MPPSGQRRLSRHAAPSTAARGFRLRFALFRRSVAAHLPARQIAQADSEPPRGVERDRPAEPDLEVVRMGTEHEEVDWWQGLHSRVLGYRVIRF